MTSCTESTWPGLFRIIDAHPDPVRLDGHGLAALAAEHWRREGRAVPREFSGIRARQVVLTLEAERIIRQVRSSAPGPMILFKGLEVAARYPEPSLRKLRDVDLLVEDVKQVEARLMNAGFQKVIGARMGVHHKAYDDLHQLRPLVCPGMSLPLELHRRPHWPTWETAPSFEELERSAQPSSLAIEGVLAPSPEHHALIVLAHSWARQPFEQLSQLVDFALLLDECDRTELGRTAARWGIGDLLEIALRTVDSLLVGEARDPMVVSWFAPQLRTLDLPTPARQQFNRYAVSLIVSPIRKAAYAAACGFGRRVRTVTREKLARRASVL